MKIVRVPVTNMADTMSVNKSITVNAGVFDVTNYHFFGLILQVE